MATQTRLPSLRVLSSLAMSFLLAASAVAVVVAGSPASGGEGFSGSVVSDLTEGADLAPLIAMEEAGVTVAPVKVRPLGARQVRQSVPDRDRAATYRTDELFRHSKVALPLLVVDLESQKVGVGVRPMSGRSVGARPSAAWTRPLVMPVTESISRPATAWTSYGRR